MVPFYLKRALLTSEDAEELKLFYSRACNAQISVDHVLGGGDLDLCIQTALSPDRDIFLSMWPRNLEVDAKPHHVILSTASGEFPGY